MLQEVNKEQYQEAKKDELHLLVFHALWCPPCRMFKSSLEELNEKDGIQVFRVDVDQDKPFAKENGVSNLPSWFIVKNEKIIEAKTGFYPYEELKKEVLKHK